MPAASSIPPMREVRRCRWHRQAIALDKDLPRPSLSPGHPGTEDASTRTPGSDLPASLKAPLFKNPHQVGTHVAGEPISSCSHGSQGYRSFTSEWVQYGPLAERYAPVGQSTRDIGRQTRIIVLGNGCYIPNVAVVKKVDFGNKTTISLSCDAPRKGEAPPPQQCKAAPPGNLTREHRTDHPLKPPPGSKPG